MFRLDFKNGINVNTKMTSERKISTFMQAYPSYDFLFKQSECVQKQKS